MKKILFWVVSYVVFLSSPAKAYFIDNSTHFSLLGATSISFSEVPLGTSASFNIGGTLFKGHGGNGLRIESNPCTAVCTPVTGRTLGNQTSGINGTGFDIFFPFDISAFGVDLAAVNSPTEVIAYDAEGNPLEEILFPALCEADSDEALEDEAAVDCSFHFGGIVHPLIRWLTVSTEDYIVLDNLQYVAAVTTPVPEPTGLVLLGLGLMGIGLSRRRNKRIEN